MDSDVVAAIEQRLPHLTAFLQEIVRIPSITGREEAAQASVAATMQDLGFDVDIWEPDPAEIAPFAQHVGQIASFAGRPNVVGRVAGSGSGHSLILNAHVDVVDAGDPERWTFPPFAGEIHDGTLYGRGACDMKAGLAVNIFALAAVRDAGIPLRGDVIVESVISEEDGGAGTLATLLRGYKADAAIITEPTTLAVVPAQGGSAVFRLNVPGKSAHGCVRDEGVSAIEKFALIHTALIDFEARRNAAIDHPLYTSIANKIPISVGVVRAGTWPSSVAESLVAEGRAGLVPGEKLKAFCAEFEAVVAGAAESDPWLREHRPAVEWFSGQFEPAEVPGDATVVQLLTRSHERATGRAPRITGVTYGADMRHFVNFAGIPCVMYGPGDVRVAHFTDEHVALDELRIAATTIALAIAEWCA